MSLLTNIAKGQVPLIGIVIGAMATVVASGLTAWGSASAKTSELSGDIRVIEERENNHYGETQKQLAEIDKKLDTLLANEGLTIKK